MAHYVKAKHINTFAKSFFKSETPIFENKGKRSHANIGTGKHTKKHTFMQ